MIGGIDGRRMEALRKARGYSLRVLAARVKDASGLTISAEAIMRAEKGEWDLSVKKTVAVAEALGVGISDIVRERVSA